MMDKLVVLIEIPLLTFRVPPLIYYTFILVHYSLKRLDVNQEIILSFYHGLLGSNNKIKIEFETLGFHTLFFISQ